MNSKRLLSKRVILQQEKRHLEKHNQESRN